MRIDREFFLLMVGSLAACHAHDVAVEPASSAVDVPPPPESSPDEPEAEVAQGGEVSLPESACDELSAPAEEGYCEGRMRTACLNAVHEFKADTAEKALGCLRQLSSGCDSCGINVCLQTTLSEAGRGRTVAECGEVSESYQEQGLDPSPIADLCTQYAQGMNTRGRERFKNCLKGTPGLGVRYCLWDPSGTPCTEGGDYGY